MKTGMVALHYPHIAHREDFLSRVRRVAEVFRSTAGCLSADYWVTVAGDVVVSIVQWESEAASAASLAAVQAADVDIDFDERESRPREILRLVSA
jgi:quinol monooxygenase YgiN